MTPRYPRTEPLIPDELLAKLIENGRTSEERDGFDPFPVVTLFMADAAATWLFTEAYPEGSDMRLFGLCDLGMGCPELGYAMLFEIEDVRGKLGLPVERDLYFKAEHRLSNYAKIAHHVGMIVT
ncbi:conserved hypothetical protein [Afipia carboxidovorans OM5]|jgi:hypothetical protein|uniref:Uncharacterized protein n=1 Tax=Afipia carboxidovorans (strain ATCC 49405 / DSM 1227 / KCTC 32145 / OM5) TaxID=504832 RepID=B6JHL8_AFIC5|nr:DUF2958 domain-containing protein [Afipia carboxidovorans]ACI93574.1 conserved hypothetical protein [Afipia carboxidovorans OM5]AEI02728.1 hypothetical protein OCA4_c15900 [Afipia carboxidovorans OM4]AEI06304.1 hypothetical protein OCA5_c15900 [Afipia carboxidovorans OM5]